MSLAVALTASAAGADVAPSPAPAGSSVVGLRAARAREIAMKREVVTLELYEGFAVVDATFTFAGAPKSATLELGFPGEGVPVGDFSVHGKLVGFTAWVAGAEVPTQDRPVSKNVKGFHGEPRVWQETWHVFSATLPARADTQVRVRYAVHAEPMKENGVSPVPVPTDAGLRLGRRRSAGQTCLDSRVFYVLSTGAAWKGPIDEVTVNVRARRDVLPDSIRVRDGHMPQLEVITDPKAVMPALLPEYGRRDEGVVLRRSALEPALADNLEIVFRTELPPLCTVGEATRSELEPLMRRRVAEP